ncbi:hypothetical protein MHBO_002303, partial [Bonamia ostreae]
MVSVENMSIDLLEQIYNDTKSNDKTTAFLEKVFGFLKNKTDFYDKKDNQKILLKLFDKTNDTKICNSKSRPKKPKTEKPKKIENNKEIGEVPPIGNGGKTDKYIWTQTLSETAVSLTFPKETRAKNLTVELQKSRLLVKLKNKEDFAIID